MTSHVTFTGDTGQSYQYEFCDVNLPWNPVPGNYCFARKSGLLLWTPLYFGETGNFASRMPRHNKLALAGYYGATHILAHVTYGGEPTRKSEETDLIRAYNPPCNIQHRSATNPLFHIHSSTGSPLADALRRIKV